MTSFTEHPFAAIAEALRAFRNHLTGQPDHLRRANEELSGQIQQKLCETKTAAENLKGTAREGIRQAAMARSAARQVIKRIEAARGEQHDGS